MAILSVNEAPQPEVSPAPEEDKSTLKMVDELFSRFKRARARYDVAWQPNYEFVFGGKQWSLDRPAWRFSEVVNYVWANMMTEVGIQTDARPRVQYNATESSDYDFAKQLEKINETNWNKYPWLQRTADAVLQSKWVHVAHAEVFWNPELECGLGDVDYKVLDPFYCYWDPTATDETNLRGFIYAAPVPTAKLKKEYPELANQIKADIESVGQSSSDVVSITSDKSWTGTKNVRAVRTYDRFGGEPHTFLIRLWLKDEATEEFEQKKDDGTVEYITKLKYPKGRYIEKCNNVILCDGPNGVKVGDKIIPYEDGEIPIARLVNYSYPLEYAGENEVTHSRGPQKVINYSWSHTLDQMKMGSNPVTIIGATSGVDPDNVTNEPGLKILANDVNQVKREPGLPVSAGMQWIMEQAKMSLDQVYGLTDVMKGAVDPAIGSGVLFDGYAEAAQVRPRLKNRNLDQFLGRVGRLMLSRYLQFYTAPRVFRMTNEQGWPEHVEFYIGQDAAGNKVANVNKMTRQPDGQVIQTSARSPIKGVPDVDVISGSSLPFAKALKSKTALEYLNAGVIDPEEVLKTVDWPNAEQVLQRMQEHAQQQAEMQQGAK